MESHEINSSAMQKFNLDAALPVLFKVCEEGLLVIDAEGTIIAANTHAESIFGYSEGNLRGNSMNVLIPPRFIPAHDQYHNKYFSDPHFRPMGKGRDLVGLRKNGEEFPVEISLNPISTLNGNFVIAIAVDISDRKNHEKNLVRNKNLLTAIIESAVDGIITISKHGSIESANHAAEQLFGYEKGELIGQKINILMPEPYHSRHDGYIKNYTDTGEKKIIGIGREVTGLKKDGTTFPFYLSVSEVDHGEEKIFAGIIHDLTHQKEAEAELKKYSEKLEQRVEARTEALAQAINELEIEIKERKLAEQALIVHQKKIQLALEKERELNELKSRFVSMASHEFRTPLATILSSISLVTRYEGSEHLDKREKHINRIKSNVRHLTNILNDFLSLSKLEEGIIEINIETFDIVEWMHDLLEEIEEQKKEGQKFFYTYQGTESVVELDPHLLKNILFNLISNAIKYSQEYKEIHISTQVNETDLVLTIEDQGMGIPESDQPYMFERFFRAKNAINIQGTGLGLSIVKRYIDLMNGQISFSSIYGKGTIFTIQLPRKLLIK
ncbi:MAG: PAS domain S-box protein [Bacteroidia bacterium]